MYRRLLRRWRLIPLSMLALAVVATGGWFQATAPSQDQVPAPTIRVTTHLVVVDVVVTDKQGKPITGLHLEDFEVEENGKAQKVSVTTGFDDGVNVEMLKGCGPNDSVIVAGKQSVTDGQRVKATEAK